jgi:branched-chain amino acid transport system permease protein
MDASLIAILLVNGLMWGLLLALLALGLSLTFGLTDVMNLAHGEFYMWGAVIGWFVVSATGSFAWGAAAALCSGSVTGLVIERFLLRRAERQVALSLILTFGLMLIMQHLALLVFGGSPRRLPAPEALEGTLKLFGTRYPIYRLFLASICGVILFLFWALVHRTRFGVWMRAVKQDKNLALSQGVPVDWVYCITFGLGAGVASLAGLLAAPIVAVEFKMGTEILPLTFMGVILGGFGDFKGPVAASICIGLMEGLLTAVCSPTSARVLTLLLVSCLLLIWPDGLRVAIQRLGSV